MKTTFPSKLTSGAMDPSDLVLSVQRNLVDRHWKTLPTKLQSWIVDNVNLVIEVFVKEGTMVFILAGNGIFTYQRARRLVTCRLDGIEYSGTGAMACNMALSLLKSFAKRQS